jgi:hypothetical protein
LETRFARLRRTLVLTAAAALLFATGTFTTNLAAATATRP